MKTTVYYISLIALLETGLVACSRLEKEVLPADDVVMQIATVGFGNPATRALTDGGVKTFAPNDIIAVFYTNTSEEVVKVESERRMRRGSYQSQPRRIPKLHLSGRYCRRYGK